MNAARDGQTRQESEATSHDRLEVSELLGQFQGASSPFGNAQFPLPAEQLRIPGAEHLSD
ncbi:MAG TPA: hypothetical protein VHU91_08470 [Mycobacteriales bacterium]|jgi:hypothetical protein|nr:hypothetical protein [Mycobacteriales bacterium]